MREEIKEGERAAGTSAWHRIHVASGTGQSASPHGDCVCLARGSSV